MEPPNKKTRSNGELTLSLSRNSPDLSTLPDNVLIHILSFMDPKEAVQTCILSKRWRNLWTCVPSLNFDKSGFEGSHAAFVHFVTNMLLFRGASKLDTFRLRWHACEKVSTLGQENCQIHVSNASAWIFSALRCKPLTISLDLYGFANLELPHALFTCSSLEHLDLQFFESRRAATEPSYVNLPNLKKLKLRCFQLSDPVMEMILSGCPLLEELSLDSCSLNFSCMKSDLLRCLAIINCRGSGLVEFFLPNLVSLSLKNEYPGKTKLSLKNTPSLVKVSVFYHHFVECYFSGAEFEFFNYLTTVTDLELYGSGVKELLEKTVPNCPIFSNLKQLTFGQWSINEKLDLLCQMLQHTPNLEKLTIVHKKDITYVPKKHARSGEVKEKCATGQIPFRCEHLKVIDIRYSDPSGAHELVGILLQNISQGERVRIDLSRF
ncbi:F-box/RNI-like superfamily protein [Rhynchospora pubera]|uniref:F-box/RNI-like superfamily protein n=1 Tax=Rhynchospora pubera TaxID=906938 RepID=A0AAV8G1A3_9POAL|nr:F-box/RNI-like superfamily protein [Rhynchospora pubera]